MPVRLSDIIGGKKPEEKKRVGVRLSDIRTARYREEQQPLKDIGMDFASRFGSGMDKDISFKSHPVKAEAPDSAALDRLLGGTNRIPSREEKKPPAKLKGVLDLDRISKETTRSVMEKQAEKKRKQEEIYNSEPPIIRDIHRGLDTFAHSKPIQAFDKVAQELYTPGAGLSVLNAGTQAAESLVGKAAPALAKVLGNRGGRIAQNLISGAAVDVPATVGNTLARNPEANNKELLQSAAYGGGGGIALRGLGSVGGKILDAGTQTVLKRLLDNGVDQARAVGIAMRTTPNLELPAPRVRGNTNTASAPDTIFGQGRVEPIGLPEPDIAPPTTGRVERVNPYRVKFERLMDVAKRTKFTPGREREELDDLWSSMASREDPNVDELINLAYPSKPNRLTPDLLQRARESQGRREIYGVPLPAKSISERYKGGVTGSVDSPVERVGRSPAINTEPLRAAPRTEVVDSTASRPRVDVTPTPVRLSDLRAKANPTDDVEEVVQSVQNPRVRDRVYSFLDEQEKSALERIKKRKNNLSSNPLNEWGDHAIVMAAQLGKGTIKAADFTEALVKKFGESIRPHAQVIYRKSKEILRQQERRASEEGQEAAAFNESGRGDAASFRNKVNRKPSKKKGSLSKWWEKTRAQLIDDMAPLEGLEKRVTGSVASAEDSLYKSARMFKGTPERAAQIVQDRLSPIVKSIEKSGFKSEDLGDYALAVHARDVNAAGLKSGFTNAEIDKVIQNLGTPEMEAARKQLIQINKDMMKELVDSGVVSKELADVLNERWKNYVPLFRAFDDEKVEFGTGLSNALANVASPIKALKGSERDVVDPLESMVKNVFQSINAAERNKVSSQLQRLDALDVDDKFIRKLNQGEEVGRKNVVNVKVNGENVKYEVEPEVYKALLNLDKESSNTFIRVLSAPATLLRSGATLTPDFALRNPMRDIVQAFVVSKSGFNPITDFGVGIIQSISKGKLYKDWVDNLGAYGNMISMDRNVHRRALEKVLKEPVSKKFVNIINGKSLLRALRYITDTTESATKVGEYRAALRKGVSKEEAAYRSRDIMDFSRAGNSVRTANKIIAFLNANIQGKSKLIRSIKENPVGTITRAFTAITVPTIGIFVLNKQFANEKQKETIDNAPDWMRNSFWLMAIPGTDVVARIPKPFDLATVFSNLPERALDYVYNNDKEAFDGYVRNSLSDASLPFQISGLQPFIEGMAGYSFFREGDITPLREQNLKFEDQYDPTRTSELGKLLASGAEKITGGKGSFKKFSSPRVMDNTIQGLTAGLGKYATDAIDVILQKTGAVNRPAAPAKNLEQKPFIRSFLADPNQGGKITDKFYDTKDKLSREKASNKLNEVTFGGTKKKPLYLDKEKQKTLDALNSAAGEVSDINKEIRTIERSMTLTPKQKREQIDALIAKRMKIIKESGVSK